MNGDPMEDWSKNMLRLKLSLLFGAGILCLTYLLKHYAERRQLLAIRRVEAAEERLIKRDQAQARRERDQRRSRTHPLVNLLEDRFAASGSALQWGAAEEAALRELALDPEASVEAASEALWRALEDGKTEAAGVLWFMGRDPKVVEALAASISDSRRLDQERAGAVFVLGLTSEPAAFRALRAEYRNALKYQDGAFQVALARALYHERQGLEFQRFLETVAAREEPPDPNEPPPSQLARKALKELGLAR